MEQYKTQEEVRAGLARIAKNAVEAQNACNSSGVVFSFARDMEVLCSAARFMEQGTDWKNQHPITKAYVTAIAIMAGLSIDIPEMVYLDVCEDISKGEPCIFRVCHLNGGYTDEPAN